MKPHPEETIVAIATPIGEGALSIVRVSGPSAIDFAESAFVGEIPLRESPGFTAHHGWVRDLHGNHVDEAIATVFREPRSYTGEDSVEFSCHGGIYVTQRVLEILLQAGARQAQPGEFTKRAFLNGRIDLSQAEAVADLIAARSGRAHLSSLEQLEGKLASHVKRMRSSLVELCSLLEIDLDFSEEEIDLITGAEIRRKLKEVFDLLAEMAASFDVGRLFREGVPVGIVGKPNAGKSSLFNMLLQSDRAIVTPVPGTTRDSLEESITISGVLFRLADTAGLQRSGDIVEAEGVERSKAVVRRVDLVIVVADSTKQHDRGAILADLGHLQAGQRVVVAHNKIDLLDEAAREPQSFQFEGNRGVEVWISAKTGEGIEQMKSELVNLSFGGVTAGEGGLYLTNRRHRDAIARSKASVERAIGALDSSASNEFIAFDVREGIEALSEITGEVTSEEILNSSFGRFCIGK